jgi:RNA polymerase sigma-70 factor (ECF subfamily)
MIFSFLSHLPGPAGLYSRSIDPIPATAIDVLLPGIFSPLVWYRGCGMRADLGEEKDERLAALAAGGDRGAFDALVTRHRQAVYRLCWSATGNAADADDAAQETFVRVYRSLPSYDPARPFGPWLRKIAWNCGLSVRRDGNAGVPRVAAGEAPEAVDPSPGPEEAAAGNEERRRVADAMVGLPAELRMVMMLRAVEGLSYAEIALAAGIPAGTVMSRLSRARTRLLAVLGGS